MNFQLFELGDDLDDRAIIVSFIRKTVDLLGDFIDTEKTNFLTEIEKVSPGLGNDYKLAFEEVKAALNPYLGQVNSNWLSQDQLKGAGLTGNNLRAKARVLNLLGERVGAIQGRLLLWDGVIDKVIKKFLDFLNRILDSLKSALGIVEILKEFKDLIEAGIGLAEDAIDDEE